MVRVKIGFRCDFALKRAGKWLIISVFPCGSVVFKPILVQTGWYKLTTEII